MSSLEALEELKDEIIPDYALEYEDDEGYKDWVIELYNTIKQDLKRLEQLEKALDLACERLNWDCPVSQDLIADLDCENRCSDDFEECCKECWKLYFLKEVFGNE